MLCTKIFITFGGGDNKYIYAAKRLIEQAKFTNYFDKIILYTDSDLKKDKYFWKKHSNFILNNKKGYGYWIWKPYIIKKTMEAMKEGDIIMYLDSGCEIGGVKQSFIPQYFDYVKIDKIIGTYYRTFPLDNEWCKMDLLVHLNMQNSNLINTPQRQAGALLIYNCKETQNIIHKWYEIACIYNMIDDSESIHKNLDCFCEHRHDQSIFSLLTKKYGIYSQKLLDECIYYIRNKTKYTRLKNGINYIRAGEERDYIDSSNSNYYLKVKSIHNNLFP